MRERRWMNWDTMAGIAAPAGLTLLGWIALKTGGWLQRKLDRRTICRWLRNHTRDEPGESHVDTPTLAKGTRLPEDRVRRACMSDPRVHRHKVGAVETWSLWQWRCIYETRGVISLSR